MAIITQTAIGLPPSLHGKEEVSMSLEVTSSSETLGAADTTAPPTQDNEPESIIYINTQPNIPQAADQLAALQKDNEMTTSFWSAKAAESADLKQKNGSLPSDSSTDSMNKRNNYRIQVIDYAIQHSNWMSTKAAVTASKNFTVAKDQLHAEIIKTVLGGLSLPPKVENNFEVILQSIGDSLKTAKDAATTQNKWVCITTYRYDDVQKKVFAGMRTIYFKVTEQLKDFNNSKNDKGQNVNVDLAFQQNDYNFNESVWESAKDKVSTFVNNSGVVSQVIDISV